MESMAKFPHTKGIPAAQQERILLPIQEMQETWVWSLVGKDHLEEGMATHPVFLPGESHGQRSLTGYSPWGCIVGHNEATEHSLMFHMETPQALYCS